MEKAFNKNKEYAVEELLQFLEKDGIDISADNIQKAKEGNGEALYRIGDSYNMQLNMTKAFVWYHKAALQNDISAQMQVADMYRKGYGANKNDELAKEWYLKAANSGNSTAQFIIGNSHNNKRVTLAENKEAMDWYKKAADNGNIDAMNKIGELYSYERGVTENLPTAVEWFTKAANQGHKIAQFNLGMIYQTKEEMKDLQKAINWYQMSADNDVSQAKSSVRRLNNKGYYANEKQKDIEAKGHVDIEYDDKELFAALRESEINVTEEEVQKAKENDGDALFNIGDAYYNIRQDSSKAFAWFYKSGLTDHNKAQFQVGFMYERGYGVTQDYKQALDWYKKIATKGNAHAQRKVGLLYLYGYGATRDVQTALQWVEMAAMQGNKDDQCYLGLIYEREKEVKDLQKAIHWYQKAADSNHRDAKKAIKRLNRGYSTKEEKKEHEEKKTSFNSSESSEYNGIENANNKQNQPSSASKNEQHEDKKGNLKMKSLVDALQSRIDLMEKNYQDSQSAFARQLELLQQEIMKQTEENRQLKEELAKLKGYFHENADNNTI